MGVFDKFLDVMRLNPDEDEDYDNDFGFDDDEIDEPPAAKKSFQKERNYFDEEKSHSAKEKQKPAGKITQMRPVKKQISSGMEVCVIKPTSVEDAREITETLLSNRTVVLNVEGLDIDIAQRIIDFTAGSCFAISGNLQKISNYIFIITPASVDISGDFQNILGASLDTSGLYTDI